MKSLVSLFTIVRILYIGNKTPNYPTLFCLKKPFSQDKKKANKAQSKMSQSKNQPKK
jgi:hypothetical protein